MAYVDDFMAEMQGEWDGIVGSLNNPLIPGGSVASSLLSTVPPNTGAAIAASGPAQGFLGLGNTVGTVSNNAVTSAANIVPSKSTVIVYIVLILSAVALLGKVENL